MLHKYKLSQNVDHLENKGGFFKRDGLNQALPESFHLNNGHARAGHAHVYIKPYKPDAL